MSDLIGQRIQIKRSNTAPSDMRGLFDGEFGYVKDTNKLYIGRGAGNQPVQVNVTDNATTTTAGLMSAADKTKLNSATTKAFSNIQVGSTVIAADSNADTFTMVAGSNVTLTPDQTNDKVTIAATDTGATTVTVTGSGNAITTASYNASTRTITLDKGATYNNYSLPQAGSSLGGIKTGGVATVSGGQITAISKATSATTASKVSNSLTVGSKTYNGSAAVEIVASDLGLSNALHFIGVKTAVPTTGTYANGDVILVGNKEYVYSGSSWIELGDESSFALKTITISGSNGLTGSGTLSGNITLSHADTSSQASVSASGRKYITGVTLDTYGHVTGLTTGTETVTDTHYTTKLFATSSSGTAHAATTNGNTYLRLFDNSTARQSIKIVGSGATTVASDANGVITINSTDNNTTYSAGTGLTLDGTTFKVTGANVSTMMNLLGEGTAPAQQGDYLIAQYAGGGTTTTTYHRRKISNIITAENVKKALGTGTGTTKYLREDGTWVVPPNSNSAHSHSAGVGLTGSGNAGTSGTYTYKVNLVNETAASNAASYTAGGTSKFYAVQLDKNNKLGVYVPWTDNNTVYTHPAGSGASKTSGFYKFSTDATSHIKAVTAVTKADITALGIPAQDTTYGVMGAATSSAAGAAGLVPAPAAGKQSSFLRGDGTWATPTNTKNTAGSTNTNSKIFLIGATSQAASPQTYSHDTVFVDSSGYLYSNSTKVSLVGHTHTLTPSNRSIYQITGVGTMFTATVSGEVLTLTAGSVPTRSSVSVMTGISIAASTT